MMIPNRLSDNISYLYIYIIFPNIHFLLESTNDIIIDMGIVFLNSRIYFSCDYIHLQPYPFMIQVVPRRNELKVSYYVLCGTLLFYYARYQFISNEMSLFSSLESKTYSSFY